MRELQRDFCKNLTEFYQISLKNLPYLTDFSPQLTACCENTAFGRCSFVEMKFDLTLKQVAQRATIAHLSPMCQSQISFQKTYKWAMETRGPKSNSSELLCLSWLQATLMMIRSKMNELAWRYHFPIISIWEIF